MSSSLDFNDSSNFIGIDSEAYLRRFFPDHVFLLGQTHKYVGLLSSGLFFIQFTATARGNFKFSIILHPLYILTKFLTSFYCSWCVFIFNSNATIMYQCVSRLPAPMTIPRNSQRTGETNSFCFFSTAKLGALAAGSLVGEMNYETFDQFIFSV